MLVATEVLRWPYLKLIAGVLLIGIGMSLLTADEDSGADDSAGTATSVIRMILLADLVLSFDNVLAVAAAAKDDPALLIGGLAISIPLVVFGSTLMIRVMERFPVVITLGATLLGFLGGDMLISDPAVTHHFGALASGSSTAAGVVGAALVIGGARWRERLPGSAA